MKTTFKQVQNNAHSLGLVVDRVPGYINIGKPVSRTVTTVDAWGHERVFGGHNGRTVMYTAQTIQEAYAWLQGYRSCVLEIVNNNTTAKEIWERVTAS